MRDPRTYAILGAAMEVHRELGCGFLEPAYQEAVAVELQSRNIPFRSQVELPIVYKGKKLHAMYRADFVCFDKVSLYAQNGERVEGFRRCDRRLRFFPM
jgi:GxxExxY protein